MVAPVGTIQAFSETSVTLSEMLREPQLWSAEKIVAKWGQIDILLNIAGGNMPGATLEPDQHFYDMDISCWEKVTNLNMNGTVYPSMIFGKVMAKQKKGCIINVSSMAAYSAITRVPGYSATFSRLAMSSTLPMMPITSLPYCLSSATRLSSCS